jgi:hypothetical protein
VSAHTVVVLVVGVCDAGGRGGAAGDRGIVITEERFVPRPQLPERLHGQGDAPAHAGLHPAEADDAKGASHFAGLFLLLLFLLPQPLVLHALPASPLQQQNEEQQDQDGCHDPEYGPRAEPC